MRPYILLCIASLAVAAKGDCAWHGTHNPLSSLQRGPSGHDGLEGTCGKEVLSSGSGWEGPEACVGEYCIYSKRGFNGGEGIVVITTAHVAQDIAAFSDGHSPRQQDPPFRPADVPGKGRGLVATRKIAKGETIMVQPPVIMVLTEAYRAFSVDEANRLYRHALEMVSESARSAVLDQFGHDLYTKVDKNGFTVFINRDSSSQHIGVFPHASFINHDCRPNINYRLNNITHTTTAVRVIQPGEELSISYVDLMIPRAERRKRLRDWGFDCTCSQCMMSDADAAASDANLERIQKLESDLDSPNATVTASMGEELVRLYEAERLDIYLGPAYTRAALNFGLFGVEDKAREYATKAISALERQYGPDASDIPSMRLLQENPQAHWSWALRKMAVLNIPSELKL